jgi:hypothetical protein
MRQTDGTRPEAFAQEFLDVPGVVGHGRFRQPLVVQQVTPVSIRQTVHGGSRNGRSFCRWGDPRLTEHTQESLQRDPGAIGRGPPFLLLALLKVLQHALVEAAQIITLSEQPAIQTGNQPQLPDNGRRLVALIQNHREVGFDVGRQRAESRALDVMRREK